MASRMQMVPEAAEGGGRGNQGYSNRNGNGAAHSGVAVLYLARCKIEDCKCSQRHQRDGH